MQSVRYRPNDPCNINCPYYYSVVVFGANHLDISFRFGTVNTLQYKLKHIPTLTVSLPDNCSVHLVSKTARLETRR